MVAIVQSVLDNRMDDQLAADSSMWDLRVTTAPPAEPPLSQIWVRSASSVRPPASGQITIEHEAVSGKIESITRPAEDAVPLFWRFVKEKYGVTVTGFDGSQQTVGNGTAS